MGKYSGYLICSDFDGTFYTGKEIPKRNMDAIRRFKAGGGLFTLATGRTVDFIPPYFPDYEFDVPIINLNGAVLYDNENKVIVKGRHMRGTSREFCNMLLDSIPYVHMIGLFKDTQPIRIPASERERLTDDICENTYKIVLYVDARDSRERSDEAMSKATELLGDRFSVVRSALTLLEILDPELTKNVATHYLKEAVGAHTLICVGDFENDIDMVREADIGYAVENAVPELKAVADRITVSVDEGAIAEIIADIDREIG